MWLRLPTLFGHAIAATRQCKVTASMVCVASSPGHSHLFNVARRKGGGPGTRSHVCDANTRHVVRARDRFVKLPALGHRLWKGRFVSMAFAS